jgi:hypothetical protein
MPPADRHPAFAQESGNGISTTVALPLRGTEGSPNRSASMWSPLAAVRGAIDVTFSGVAPDVLDAIRMASCELGENILKYGEPVEGIAGHVTVSRTADGVELRAVSRLTDSKGAARLFRILNGIVESRDLRASFEERMLQIIQDPLQESTGLGLLRIAYEGLFVLSSSYEEGTLTIVAARSLL